MVEGVLDLGVCEDGLRLEGVFKGHLLNGWFLSMILLNLGQIIKQSK